MHKTDASEEVQTLTYEKPNSAYILFYEKKKKNSTMELRDSHMSDMAEVSAGVFDLNMNPEMALMVEKDNLQATYRANLFEKSYFNLARPNAHGPRFARLLLLYQCYGDLEKRRSSSHWNQEDVACFAIGGSSELF